MTLVLDTSVLIDHLRGSEPARDAIRRAQVSGRVVASLVTKIEVLAGMRPAEERSTRRLLQQLEWVDVDDEVAEQAGRLARTYAPSHGGVELADFVVAATAEILGADLWTRNIRHFPMFPALVAPY